MLLSPLLKKYGMAALLLAGFLPAGAQSITEDFDNITTLTASGWATQNRSNPVGTSGWFQGTTAFTSFNGAANSFIAANYQNTGGNGTISNWLFTPTRTLNNGDVISFYTRIPAGTEYPDRLELRLSTTGTSTNVGTSETSVGDFTTLLRSVNPTLTTGVYPQTWTQYSVTLSGLPAGGVSGRAAFRYFVTDAGLNGNNSNYIGIDAFRYVAVPPPTCATSTITNLSGSNFLCPGTLTVLTVAGTGTSYQWNLNGNPIPGAINDAFQPTLPGVYTVTATGPGGCTQVSTNSITIKSLVRPTANFSFDSYCAGRAVRFTNTSVTDPNAPVTYRYTFGDAANSSSTLPNTSFTYNDTGARNVKLVAVPGGCTALADSITKTIRIEGFTPGMNLEPVNVKFDFPTELQARDLGTGAQYIWDPPVMISSATIRNPIIRAQREQLYHITITKASGCVTVDTLLVRIFRDFDIQVPTAFSPNGDGSNDRLRPLTVGIASFRVFRVYDRLGRELFSSTVSTQGWDGTHEGKMMPSDTYIWVAEGYDQTGGFVRRSGQVVLVR